MGMLRDRMIEEMKLRNFSPAPDQLDKEQIRSYLVHLTMRATP